MKRRDTVEQAKAIRTSMDAAGAVLTEEQAARCKEMYPLWDGTGVQYWAGDGEHPQSRVRGRESGLLYKCEKDHLSQSDWAPEQVVTLWTIINVEQAGTADDPITAYAGMEYEYGKYYLDPEDGKTYLCQREGESGSVTLYYLPHELVGNYFVEVST